MLFEEFEKNIYFGWCNQGTYIDVTLYYVNRENPSENKENRIKFGLNPPVDIRLTLNISIDDLKRQAKPAIQYWYNELYSDKHIEKNDDTKK